MPHKALDVIGILMTVLSGTDDVSSASGTTQQRASPLNLLRRVAKLA
jgi:hypothetical protein